MAKNKQSLPVITISDSQNDSEKRYILNSYVRSAIMGIQLLTFEGNPEESMDEVNKECSRLLDELNS